jgi:hypothetical protein
MGYRYRQKYNYPPRKIGSLLGNLRGIQTSLKHGLADSIQDYQQQCKNTSPVSRKVLENEMNSTVTPRGTDSGKAETERPIDSLRNIGPLEHIRILSAS